MESYIVIVIIFGIIILVVLSLLFFINRLTLFKLDVENSFASIMDYAYERGEIFERMSSFLSSHYENEGPFLEAINISIQSLKGIRSAVDGVLVLKKSDDIFLKFQGLKDVYLELKNNREYLDLIYQYEENRDRIYYAADVYDKEVFRYNQYREKGIVLRIHSIFRFPVYDYYKK